MTKPEHYRTDYKDGVYTASLVIGDTVSLIVGEGETLLEATQSLCDQLAHRFKDAYDALTGV